jgi:type II secretory pathway pseudopilin PulG
MLEMIMAILIIGILSSLVLPKFNQSKKTAQIAKVKSDIASIRMGIILDKNKRIMSGKSGFTDKLDNAKLKIENEELFNNNILNYPIYSVDSNNDNKTFSWSKIKNNQYRLWLSFIKDELIYVDFIYIKGTGIFNCDKTKEYCRKLQQ